MTEETTTEQLAEIEGQAEPVQVREGRWRTRGGSIRNVTPTPQDHESFPAAYLWWDGFDTWRNDGRWWAAQETTSDLVEYLGPIEQDKTQELPEYTPPEGWRVLQSGELLQPGDHWVNWEGTVSRPDIQHGDGATASGGRYIRNIDIELQAVKAQLAAVKAELVTQAETSRRLQIELDAAQQVPADSPELRQLRADLAEVTQDRDTYRHAHELLVNDVNATHQRTKVMTVEAIVEWLVPIRTCGSQALAAAVVSNLPHIMRSLTGLEDEEIE